MAKKGFHPTKEFKKGNPGGGRKKLPPEINAAKAAELEQFMRWTFDVMNMKLSGFGKTSADIADNINKMPLGQRAVAKWFIDADSRGIEYCHNRLWGKVTESVNLNLNPIDVNLKRVPLTPEEKEYILKEVGIKIDKPDRRKSD